MLKEKNLLSQTEAAEYLGTSVGTLNTWRHLGKNPLPEIKWGRRIRYRKADLDAWIEKNIIIPQSKGDDNV